MDWLNNFHEAANGVRTGIEYLERISDSLHFVGNEQLATKIDDELDAIRFYFNQMETAVSEMIHQDYKQAQENFFGAFSGILDAIEGGGE